MFFVVVVDKIGSVCYDLANCVATWATYETADEFHFKKKIKIKSVMAVDVALECFKDPALYKS